MPSNPGRALSAKWTSKWQWHQVLYDQLPVALAPMLTPSCRLLVYGLRKRRGARRQRAETAPCVPSRASSEHLLELPRRDGGLQVVVAAQVLPLDEDVRHGALAGNLQERGLDIGAVIDLVELRMTRRAKGVMVTRARVAGGSRRRARGHAPR